MTICTASDYKSIKNKNCLNKTAALFWHLLVIEQIISFKFWHFLWNMIKLFTCRFYALFSTYKIMHTLDIIHLNSLHITSDICWCNRGFHRIHFIAFCYIFNSMRRHLYPSNPFSSSSHRLHIKRIASAADIS